MTSRLKKLLLCSVCLLSPVTHALTLNAKLTGEELVWQNGMRVSGYLTSTNWQILGSLAPTTEWAPGTFMAAPSTEVTLSNGTDSVTVPVEVTGMQYGLGAAADKFPDQVSSPGGMPCSSFQLQAATALVFGSGCTAGNAYQGTTLYTPFQFARPLVTFDDAALISAFRAASLPEGTYSGTIATSPFYMYRSQGGAWTYRQFGPMPLTVQIYYVPAFLTNVQVLGNGIMTPTYDTITYSVTGETVFKVRATGLFTSGVKLTFEDRTYELKHSDVDSRIAYDVTCPACSDVNIVKDGALQLASRETTVPGAGSFVAFDLLVGFEASESEVETGRYTDSLMVYFEENL
ncbi:hypothetical protein C4G95_RS23065 [Vibrio parahaemolyticus]|nr:hypothetical protein [Vibrio parahaemolyticus]EIA1343594.1 hypothetical protein [Vibrio parahaemolyticus]EIA1590652.1 hypothetical protein [Vibrio parahaemolyticus]EIA1769763.1 hypothetical protein [Vibrio parahaemolyticus]EJG0961865.1 hypothetical protein [Vibrio parahaemolyticus]